MLKEWLRSSILALIFAIFITAFVLQNAGVITVSFVFKQVQTSLAIVIIVSVLVGVICTGVIAVLEQMRSTKKMAELEKKLKELAPAHEKKE